MATDEVLADSVRGGAPPTLRFYRWDPPCLSLGRNQPARGRYDPDRLRARGMDVVRRPTGGRAVLHARELTYSAAVPERLLGGPRVAYAAVNRALVAGLRRLGVPVEVQGPTGTRAVVPSLVPCFAEAAEGEVMAGGGKLVGSAQRRERGVLLQHGSLPFEAEQQALAGFLREPQPHHASAATSLAAFCDPLPSWEELTIALAAGWEEVFGVELRPDTLGSAELRCVARAAEHHRDPAWVWRR